MFAGPLFRNYMNIYVDEVFLDDGLHRFHDAVHPVLVAIFVRSYLIVLSELTLELVLSDVWYKFIKKTAYVVRFSLLVLNVNQELNHPALHDDATEVL